MTDADKLELCKAIINDSFELGIDSEDEAAATMRAVLVAIGFGEDK